MNVLPAMETRKVRAVQGQDKCPARGQWTDGQMGQGTDCSLSCQPGQVSYPEWQAGNLPILQSWVWAS